MNRFYVGIDLHSRSMRVCLIDEAGTGTDPEEGGALAQAVLEQFTKAGARDIENAGLLVVRRELQKERFLDP